MTTAEKIQSYIQGRIDPNYKWKLFHCCRGYLLFDLTQPVAGGGLRIPPHRLSKS
jgi:hypothetical protein